MFYPAHITHILDPPHHAHDVHDACTLPHTSYTRGWCASRRVPHLQRCLAFATGRIPYTHGLVKAATSQRPAVGAERHAFDNHVVALDGAIEAADNGAGEVEVHTTKPQVGCREGFGMGAGCRRAPGPQLQVSMLPGYTMPSKEAPQNTHGSVAYIRSMDGPAPLIRRPRSRLLPPAGR